MTDELPILDESGLAELRASVGDDDDFMRDLINTFLAEEPANLELVAAAAARGDAEAIVRPAHTLKSSAAAIGAARLSAICRQIEFAGREGRTTELAALTEDAQEAWAATVTALRAAGLTT
ncbi:MAG: two-component system, sensor histidine kinase [Chloroflexota bacterium]|jgi:HPt (histidine-containing phosphotransfer) domain-containing protein|nr:two-component system, sensor histidine kinase [Chloroflexota bacterium]